MAAPALVSARAARESYGRASRVWQRKVTMNTMSTERVAPQTPKAEADLRHGA